jgi:hypothetical protein
MATLATYFRDTSARRNSRPVRLGRGDADTDAARYDAVRAQADPCLLRALPNDSIYFYSKKIDNSRVVRQADPAARGECWSAVGAAGVLLMLAASIIAPHVGSVLAGYKLETLKLERHRSGRSGSVESRAADRTGACPESCQSRSGSGDPPRCARGRRGPGAQSGAFRTGAARTERSVRSGLESLEAGHFALA